MRVYLDNCCFNRPFDDQRQLRIRLEAEAKLRIQEVIREGGLQLAWSYVLFITTDDQVLGKADRISEIKIVDPIEFIKKELP